MNGNWKLNAFAGMDGKCALRAIRHDCAKRAQHTARFSILFHIIFKTKHTKKFELKRKWKNLRALELMKRSFFIPYFCIRLCFHSVLRTFFVFSLQKWCFSALCVANIGYSFLHVSQFTICPSTDAGRTHSKWCIKYFVRSCGLQAAYFYFFAHAIRIDLMATRTTTTAIKIGVEWTDNFRTFLDYFSSFHHCHVCASVACRNEIRDYESYSLFFFSFPLQALLVRPYLRHQIHRMTLAFWCVLCGRRQMERMCSLCAKCFILLWLCDGPKQKSRLQRVHESRYRLSPDRHSIHSIDGAI